MEPRLPTRARPRQCTITMRQRRHPMTLWDMLQHQFGQRMPSSSKSTQDDYHNRQYPQVLSSMSRRTLNAFSARIHLLTSMTEGYKTSPPEVLGTRLMQAEA